MENIQFALPEIIILVTLVMVLIVELWRGKDYPFLVVAFAVVGLFAAGLVSYLTLGQFEKIVFSGLYISDDLACLLKCFIALCVILAFIYAKPYLEERQLPYGEFYILGLLSTLGMMSLVSAHSLLSLYLSLELLTLPLYAMTALRRRDGDGTEAAMKYFVLGSIASGMLLFGMSLVFGATGNLDLHAIGQWISGHMGENHHLILFGMVLIIAGIGFKLASVPFHMWLPDVYQGAPLPTLLFLGAAPKIAGMGMALRLLTLMLGGLTATWQPIVMVMALASVVLGNFAAIAQTNLKRLLAYSTISHMGYAMFGLLAGTAEGYAAATYYVVIYAIMAVCAFALIGLLSRNGTDIDEIDDLRGLNQRNPVLAFMMLLVMFSMAGMPPTVGFFAKLYVLKALIDAYWIKTAVVGLLLAVIGAVYYLRIVKVMYFDKAIDLGKIEISSFSQCLFSFNCLLLLYWGIFPSALIERCIAAFIA